MKKHVFSFSLLFFFFFSLSDLKALSVGVGKIEITPELGVPSAGYYDRHGEGTLAVHDPLLAIALFIDNGEKKIVLCSVDHLGFPYELVQEITKRVHEIPSLETCEVYIGSSHTHSGGGAYSTIPFLGEQLAGRYNAQVVNSYITKTAEAIIAASKAAVPAKIGIGYSPSPNLSFYRANWPKCVSLTPEITLIKVTTKEGQPLAALFNFPVHPTVLNSQNRAFSADFVGYARDHLQTLIGKECEPLYFNGAQADIGPSIHNKEDLFASCAHLGKSLAENVKALWDTTPTEENLHIATHKLSYTLYPKATPFGLILPVESYPTEMNSLIFNKSHVFLTIPGELTTFYEKVLKEEAKKLKFTGLSILGLTNDAHGYILLKEAWQNKTAESALSFGGEDYGEFTKERALSLLTLIP